MNNVSLALASTWKVLLASMLLGAGLPALFAVGMRALAYGTGGDAEVSHERPHRVGLVVAIACFAIVLVGVGLGLTFIVASGFGKVLSFEHVYPVLVDKH